MRWLRCLCLINLLAVVLVGCGQSSTSEGPETLPDSSVKSNAEMKERLQYVAETGAGGSALAGMREILQGAGDESLLTDFDALEKADQVGDMEKVKQIAKRMIGKL